MKQLLLITSLFLIFSLQNIYSKEYKIKSPDGTIVLTISVDDTITYTLIVDGKKVMNPSMLAMSVSDYKTLGENARVIRKKTRSVNQILYPEVKVKSKEIQDIYNELELTFKGNYSLFFRVYDNGVGYRFKTKFKNEIIVKKEVATFNFTEDAKVYFPRESEFFSHNERLYEYGRLDTLLAADLGSLPLLVESSANIKLLITETALLNYPGMWLTGNTGNSLTATFPPYALETSVDGGGDNRSTRVSKGADYISKTTGNRSFPWRIICISKTDGDLIMNQLSYQMAEPSRIKDTSWIKPGKVAWDWWNSNNIYGVDFVSGVNTETYKYYIDFASKYGLEYIILDEGWYKLGNALKVVPEIDMKELIAYGNKKNVEIILWVTWSSIDKKLKETLDVYEAWGVKGLKVDFMQRDDQWMVNYYERVALECAKRKMLVDFHGSYKPAGLRRTYPNVISREGVKGAENNKWASFITPKHNVTIPFIRMVAGPMDYTPGAMLNFQKKNFATIWNRPMSMGTRCHQLAMYTIFESPLQMLCDNPSNYLKEHETTKFISEFPSVWDETKVLAANISSYIVLARKNGENWYLGAMTNNEARTIDIDYSFLGEGKYTIEIFKDGVNAHRTGNDYKRALKSISKNDIEKIKMAPGGGWAARIFRDKN